MKNKLDHLRIAETLESFAKSESTVRHKRDKIEIHKKMISQHFWQFQQREDLDKHQRPIRRIVKPKNIFLRKILAAFIEKGD